MTPVIQLWMIIMCGAAGPGVFGALAGGLAGYRLGRRDGLEEKSWLAELAPVPEPESALAPLDLNDPVDVIIYHARMTG